MKNLKYLIVTVLLLILAFGSASAETIRLKNGKTVEGTILEKTDKYIKVDFQGVTLTYYNDEVERIDSAETTAIPPTVQATTPMPKGEPYVDKEYGFEIREPKGWVKKIIPPIPGRTERRTLQFKRVGSDTVFPQMAVSTDFVSEFVEDRNFQINSAVDLSKYFLLKYRKIVEETGGTLRVVEEPRGIDINGTKAGRCIFDRVGLEGKYFRVVDYKFLENDLFISISGMDWAETFETALKDFEAVAKSFKFLD